MAGASDSWLDTPATEAETARIRDPGFWDYVKDIGSSAASGMRKNVSSYPGTGGDLYDLLSDVGIVEAKLKGATPERLEELRRGVKEDRPPLPTTEDVHQFLTKNPYEPKTGPGRVTETVTSLVGPRGLTKGLEHLGRNVVVPFISGEAAQWIAEKLGLGPEETELLTAASSLSSGPAYEGVKRTAVKTVQGSTAPEAATTIQTLQGVDAPLTPELPNARQERLRRLRDEGVEVTGGQALGSETMRRWETGPTSTKGSAQNQSQARQFTRAVLKRVGIDADVASPEVMNAAQQRFGQFYQDLIQQNNGVVMDPTLAQALTDIGSQFEGTKGTAKGTHVERFFNRIVDASAQHGGVIPPDVFNAIHSELAAAIQSTAKAPENSTMTGALRDMQDALYDTIGRNGQPEIQAQAKDLNNRYRNFKIVQKSIGGPGEGVSFGLVSPDKLRSELERRDPAAYTQGRGDLAQIARDAQSLTALPSSGTGAQLASSGLSGLATMPVNMAISGALTSRPVRTSLVNRALGDNPAYFDPMQAPPIISQSTGEDVPMLPYPGMPAPVEPLPEETAAPPVIAPAQAAPAPVEPEMLPPLPGQRSELSPDDMPAPIPIELAELLGGRRLPMRV
jgi:hypothetical protein